MSTSDPKKAIILRGPPGAGKSTIEKIILARQWASLTDESREPFSRRQFLSSATGECLGIDAIPISITLCRLQIGEELLDCGSRHGLYQMVVKAGI